MKISVPGLRPVLVSAIIAASGQPAFAADGAPTSAQLLQLIQQQQKAINKLKAALAKTQRTSEQAAMKAEDAVTVRDGESEGTWWSRVTVGGVIEVEATSTGSFANNDSSDLALGKVELFVDANPVKFVNTHVQLLFEDGSSNITLDEAFVTLGDTDEFPAYLQAGQFAVPFGNFDTGMSTDPLTKDLAETKEASVLVGAVLGDFSVQGYVYNGDSQRSGNGDHIDQGGVFAGYAGETGDLSYDFGVGLISNVADSDGLTDGAGASATALNDYIHGVAAHGAVGFGPIGLRAAYLTALDDFTAAELAFNGKGAKPGAWHMEGTYTVDLMGRETVFAATVQGTNEALALGLPEYRYGGAVTVGVIDHVAVTGEYLHDEDYDISNGGTGNDGHTATVKLAVDF